MSPTQGNGISIDFQVLTYLIFTLNYFSALLDFLPDEKAPN